MSHLDKFSFKKGAPALGVKTLPFCSVGFSLRPDNDSLYFARNVDVDMNHMIGLYQPTNYYLLAGF